MGRKVSELKSELFSILKKENWNRNHCIAMSYCHLCSTMEFEDGTKERNVLSTTEIRSILPSVTIKHPNRAIIFTMHGFWNLLYTMLWHNMAMYR